MCRLHKEVLSNGIHLAHNIPFMGLTPISLPFLGSIIPISQLECLLIVYVLFILSLPGKFKQAVNAGMGSPKFKRANGS